MKVAIFGSRRGYDKEQVDDFLRKLWAKQGPSTTVISGGAEGVDMWAEQGWLALGGKVLSYRPVKVSHFNEEDSYAVELWNLSPPGGTSFTARLPQHPEFSEYEGAAVYRDMVIAEEADRGVAFRYKESRGTTLTIGFFENLGKPVYVYEGGQNGTRQE